MERKVYSRDSASNVHNTKKRKKMNNKQRKQYAIKTLANWRNEDGTQKESKIERKVRLFLEKQEIFFEQEFGWWWNDKYKSFDFLVKDNVNYTFLVEIHGNYWHAYDFLVGKHKRRELTKTQKQNLWNDDWKSKMAKDCGYPLLVFWEHEVQRGFPTVEERILAEIDRQKIAFSGN